MKTNYEINKEKIMDDYYKCIGAFINCEKLFKDRESYKIIKGTPKEEKLTKQGIQEDILSNLGKVGEKAFKYIIGLENLKINPNQDENTFESLWKKNNTLKEFAKKHGIKEDNKRLEQLLNYIDDNNQKAHNFHYWFLVIDTIMNTTRKKFEKFIEYTIQSDVLINYCEENNEFKYLVDNEDDQKEELSLAFRAALFPNLINVVYDNVPSIKESEMIKMIWLKKVIIKKNGDIFTRLRYASNNKEHEKFRVEEVYEIINIIIRFIKMIHENNDNLDFDLDKSYAKEQALRFKEYLKLSEQEINDIFDLDIIGTDLALIAFENNYKKENIINLLNMGVKKEDLNIVISLNLTPRIINYFFKKGINDYIEMRELINNYLDEYIPEEEKIYKK